MVGLIFLLKSIYQKLSMILITEGIEKFPIDSKCKNTKYFYFFNRILATDEFMHHSFKTTIK